MKNLLYILLIVLSVTKTQAQDKFYTKNGKITFEASVPSFEEVKAKNNTVTAILNTKSGEIAALALMKGFRFKVALMEEHFNENFAESDQFPKAKFSGKILDFNKSELSEIPVEYIIKGKLIIHGISQNFSTNALVLKNNNTIQITTKFILKPEDFNIKIPKIVRKKIAQQVDVQLRFELLPKKKRT